MPSLQVQPPSPTLLQAANLAAIPWLRHGFSTRLGGISTVYGHPTDLNLGLTPADSPTAVHENRSNFLKAVTGSSSHQPWTLVVASQIHSTYTHTVTTLPTPPIEADGLLTTLPSAALAILTADCVPILVADTRLRVVAALHAGWRGTAARIVEHGIQLLRDQHASHPQDLVAVIGPSIGPCCYEVGEELHPHFSPELIQNNHLDLWQANRLHLLASGLAAKNIETLEQCTACARTHSGRRLFFSHRAEQGNTGRMMSLIGIA